MTHKILELYSGIGGMHSAWRESKLQGDIAVAIDINTVANEVYKHNFPDTCLLNRNIQSLTVNEINKMDIDTILMSPPCQPFTRNGKYLDENDARTQSFLYILRILDKLENIQYILMENVKGFECSLVRNTFIEVLQKCNFDLQEFLLCPSSVGVPNSRLRYYCIAKRHTKLYLQKSNEIIKSLPNDYGKPPKLQELLDLDNCYDDFLIPDKLLKKANILDICYKDSNRSCCFTKAYSHYVEGTGSVYTEHSPELVLQCYSEANTHAPGSAQFINCLKPLKLRFFTPNEVLCLMSFPSKFNFPSNITRKQSYRLLGNSVNVKVISELLKILFE